jgi:hypothetical protein
MERLSVARAKSTWLFDINDLNPRGEAIFSKLIDFLKDNYKFAQFPKSPTDVDETKGLSFKNGSFEAHDGTFIHVELIVYGDGLAGNSYSSTMDTDKFLEDVLIRASLEFGLSYAPEMIRRKIPLSEVVVRLDGSLTKIDPRLNEFAAKISEYYKQVGMAPEELRGISFWADPTQSALPPAPFTIEHKIGAPFSEGRYFSKASLHTDKHLELLKDFEQTFMK